MLKRIVSGVMLTLLLLGMLTFAFNIQPTQLEPRTITVPDDYPIIQEAINEASPTDTIYVRSGTYYENIIVNKTVSLIGENRKSIIDGNGTETVVHITANNVNITGFIIQNSGSSGKDSGINIEGASGCTISGNILINNSQGIRLEDSRNNGIYDNVIDRAQAPGHTPYGHTYGIVLCVSSTNNIIINNTIINATIGISLKPSVGNNTIADNILINHDGFYIWDSDNNIITNNTIASIPEKGSRGIYLSDSDGNVFTSNTITNSRLYGIQLFAAYDNVFKENNVKDNYHGMYLEYSRRNIISQNNFTKNNNNGIYMKTSTYNTISGNNIANNYCGIVVGSSSNYNSISENNITANNRHGIELIYSSNNSIYHNNFINNTAHVYVTPGYINNWDDGYPSGGNYWSDYAGVDLFSGPYQNETGSDGIGDTSYVIGENNTDRYPLMGPFNSFNTSVGYSVDVISNSTIEDFRYFESNSTIVVHVSNMTVNQTVGFCRLTIPHELIAPPYNVTVNNTPVEYNTILENETLSIIYFTYEHSKLEIIIVPEFPSIIILLLAIVFARFAIILTKRKTPRKTQINNSYSL